MFYQGKLAILKIHLDGAKTKEKLFIQIGGSIYQSCCNYNNSHINHTFRFQVCESRKSENICICNHLEDYGEKVAACN